ncbi:plasmid partition protein ParG [Paracoccus panacisoli]|uniref:Plasmid partition protein ParG n=1 Tax=Paracoccus panacisoli TaxID=1510163 RepID=A0ABV6TC05_9RHOB
MSKKTFSAAPKPRHPTDEQILAFERGGSGHDNNSAAKPIGGPAGQGPTKRLSLDLPETLHTRFKTACSATGRKMAGELQAFIEARAAELEAEAGIPPLSRR